MYCPTCQAVVPVSDAPADEQRCPVCGGGLRQATGEQAAAVSSESVGSMAGEGAPLGYGPCLTSYILEHEQQGPRVIRHQAKGPWDEPNRALIVRRTTESAVTLFERVAALPTLAWRQPAVRAAVKTGAGAIALSLAARAARRWLQGPQQRRGSQEGLLPALADALGSPERRAPMQRDHGQDDGALVIETFIYARRVIRR